ncbi:spore protease YyaC [Anaerosalibacter sp. Marseille-P3206]|uniref:spore protease YyaC n=1 Tax=Anaerosalibacter sp. Marseille-P3206 TaxID=1871005 RepID=UPI00098605E2|nr:spore protease YyaC [Anaerosalibacter sp. Marseille-P3206]
MNLNPKIESSSVNCYSPMAVYDLSNYMFDTFIQSKVFDYDQVVILCIGSDRSTGDSLGPLVGYKLKSMLFKHKEVVLLGTLDEPVHAKNLEEKIEYIYANFSNPFILAIDASLGQFDKIGFINIRKGPLKPGLGVNKILPTIGHVSITGVVNASGIMEYVVLQNTRLNLVMRMAEVISKSIHLCMIKYKKIKSN